MRMRKGSACCRQAAWVLAIVLALLDAKLPARGGEHRMRTLPAYATQPPGASFEGYPPVGKKQKAQIAHEVVCASLCECLRAPCRSMYQVVGRTAERLAVRAREVVPIELAPWIHGCHFGDVNSLDLGPSAGPPTPARLTLLCGSEPAIRAALDLISSARCRIDLMMYGWEEDPTGRAIAAALAERARAGVQIRLLIDRTGFLIHNSHAAEGVCTFLDALRCEPNVRVIDAPDPFCRFDHRKLVIIDDRIVWTGGMLFTEVARTRWHNVAYLAQGPIVPAFAATFARRWEELGGMPAAPCAGASDLAVEPNACVRLVHTDVGERSLKQAVYRAVDRARCRIYIENPYFSDEILVRKLIAARARGVEVHAIITLRGNMHVLNEFSNLTANRLLRGGVRVYLFPIMTHVKAMSVDSTWAYLGTGNFDELSLRNNREIGLAISSPAVVGKLDGELFRPDLAASQELCEPLPMPRRRLLLEALSLWY